VIWEPGHFSENIVHFIRVLRTAGMPVGPERTLTALQAVDAVGVDDKAVFRAALEAVLVSRQEHQPIFDEAFRLFWRHPRFHEKRLAAQLPKVFGRGESKPEVSARLARALTDAEPFSRPKGDEKEVRFDAAMTFSHRDVLRYRDFETMTPTELSAVQAMLARLRLPLPELRLRRTIPAERGPRVDLRATMRRTLGGEGTLAPLARRDRRRHTPPLVALCDISGSMDRYSRMLMHFLHAITNDRDRVHVFLFGTRLTNVTRQLRHRDVDVALAHVGTVVSDWAGGTRIGACLEEFNRRWSRRVLAQNAVVLLISDGLDADGGQGVGPQMERLSKSCYRLIWLNPLLRYDRFEPRPAGIQAMLPHVDDFLPVHNLESLVQLAAVFEATSGRARRVFRSRSR